MAYVEQDPLLGVTTSVTEALYAGEAPVMAALREYEMALSMYEKAAAEGATRCVFFRRSVCMSVCMSVWMIVLRVCACFNPCVVCVCMSGCVC